MSSYRTEINIPVNKDNRTMEQRRNDTFETFERTIPLSQQYNNMNGGGLQRREESTSSRTFNRNTNDMFQDDPFMSNDIFSRSMTRPFGNRDGWDTDINDWVSETRRRWDEETERMRKSMFSIESERDQFDYNRGRDQFLRPRVVEPSFQHSSPNRMYRDHSPLNNTPMREKTTHQQSMFSSSSGSSPYGSFKKTSTQTNCYEMGPDGQLYFKIRFNAPMYKPEDIKVTCTGSTVDLIASNKTQTSSGELHKTITVPENVDTKSFQCHLTKDGVLVMEAPVASPEYSKICPVESPKLSSSRSSNEISDGYKSIQKRDDTQGPVIMIDEQGNKKMRLELPVDDDYIPSDFSLKTELNNISIKGRHEVKTATSSSFKEFSRFYTVMETIDPMTVTFTIKNGLLVVEAKVE